MCSSKPKEPVVLIQTTYGNIKVKLYNETPIHRDNFLKLAGEGFYKHLTFHRVINDFMIQGGDPETRDMAETDTIAEDKTMGSTIPAEIKFPMYFHKKGALAAARWGDAENPQKASDPSQFYIVTGMIRSDSKLDEIEKQRFERLKQKIYSDLQSQNMDSIKSMYKDGRKEAIAELRAKLLGQAEKEAGARKPEITYTEEQREFYKVRGGTPHLDNEYTVFGEVIEGMDVVDKIQKVRTNGKDKPLKNIFMNVVVVEK
jgi:peptidylprolyl isomerase/peptidyl-prolyl cis-trans isomerase B (cyclophilin B)